MTASKVYFTSIRSLYGGDSLPVKLEKMMKKAGFGDIDFENKFVAIKMHFGEKGNMAYLRPNYARTIVDMVKELGGKPFLTDCNTMYVGSRKNALEHLYCAWENGYSPIAVNCPIIIGDGLKGTDDVDVEVPEAQYIGKAHIGRAIMDADIVISLSHFKGHESTGFGGALKNLGMGCGSRAGKAEQHSNGKPAINEDVCRGCKRCQRECANNGLVYDEVRRKMTVDYDHCVGCGRCLGGCAFDAIEFREGNAVEMLNLRMAEYAKAVVQDRPNFHVSLVIDVSPYCDCHGENDAPILPNIGMFCSFDPVALDQACVDACLKQDPLPNSLIEDHLNDSSFCDRHNHFLNACPEADWQTCLKHAEEIGLGQRTYELIEV